MDCPSVKARVFAVRQAVDLSAIARPRCAEQHEHSHVAPLADSTGQKTPMPYSRLTVQSCRLEKSPCRNALQSSEYIQSRTRRAVQTTAHGAASLISDRCSHRDSKTGITSTVQMSSMHGNTVRGSVSHSRENWVYKHGTVDLHGALHPASSSRAALTCRSWRPSRSSTYIPPSPNLRIGRR
jgi:hypothetical protein